MVVKKYHLDANGNPINILEQAKNYLDKYKNENILQEKQHQVNHITNLKTKVNVYKSA